MYCHVVVYVVNMYGNVQYIGEKQTITSIYYTTNIISMINEMSEINDKTFFTQSKYEILQNKLHAPVKIN